MADPGGGKSTEGVAGGGYAAADGTGAGAVVENTGRMGTGVPGAHPSTTDPGGITGIS
jgi:hypothetical protein